MGPNFVKLRVNKTLDSREYRLVNDNIIQHVKEDLAAQIAYYLVNNLEKLPITFTEEVDPRTLDRIFTMDLNLAGRDVLSKFKELEASGEFDVIKVNY